MAFVNLRTLLDRSPESLVRPFLTKTELDDVLSASSSPANNSTFHSSSFSSSDSCGLPPGTILELSGRPSSGKTTIALSAAVEALGENITQAFLDFWASPSGLEPLPSSTHVVWVSSATHHAFAPSLLHGAIAGVISDALETRKSDPEVGNASSEASRALLDEAFHLVCGVDSPHSLLLLCKSLRTSNSSDGGATPQFGSLNKARRILWILDCGAAVLSNTDDSPLMAAITTAVKSEGGQALYNNILSESAATTHKVREGDEAGKVPPPTPTVNQWQAYQFTVHELKRSLHNVMAFWQFQCGIGAAAVITNITTSSDAPRPLGGSVWAATATDRVHMALVEQQNGAGFRHTFVKW